jgi:surfactin synthase thioesterase subunit
MRLFCLPYAGGAATIYHRWQAGMPDEVDVCPIELPGRLSRLNDPPFREMGPLVRALSAALDPHLDLPFALFGYSMGALVAFEWARDVALRRGLEPVHVIVAARGAPHLPSSFVHVTDSMTDRDLIARIVGLYGARIEAVLSDRELLAIVLRMMRADLGLLDTYRYQDGQPLRAPITVLGGMRDAIVPRDALDGWAKQTSGAFDLRMFAGDHFFLHAEESSVIAAVKGALGLT